MEKHVIDKLSDDLMHIENGAYLNRPAGQSCLSCRQLIRKFEERTGVSTKTLQRIIRFDKILQFKAG